MPKTAHPAASAAIKDIYNAEDIDKAQVPVEAFEVDFGAKYPKAVAKITDDLDILLEFYRYPAGRPGARRRRYATAGSGACDDRCHDDCGRV